MDLELQDKVALVTGGSRGIGRAIALSLAKEGVYVAFSYTSQEAAAEETLAMIRASGGQGSMHKFDVKDPTACQGAVDALAKERGLHILVNNAGVALDGLLMRYKDDDLLRSFETNVFGPFYLARAAARTMMKGKWGRIIMLGSVIGEIGNTGQSAYAATKAALDGLSRSIARELASRNITANVVAPGYIETDMTKSLPEQARAKLVEMIPAGQVGAPEDIAHAVTFLCSERARYITGQVLEVNGGLHM